MHIPFLPTALFLALATGSSAQLSAQEPLTPTEPNASATASAEGTVLMSNEDPPHTGEGGIRYASNLTAAGDDQLTDWAHDHADDSRWGYRLYRTCYGMDDAEWGVVMKALREMVLTSLGRDAEFDGEVDRDPRDVKEKVAFEVMTGEEIVDWGVDDVRAHFRSYMQNDFKGVVMGGFQHGGYMRLNLPGMAPDGLGLNQCLLVDEDSADSILSIDPAASLDDLPLEDQPYVIAVDGVYDEETFEPSTSWTEEYRGWYRVPVANLLLDFYQLTYESRPMEHFAPHAGSEWYSSPFAGQREPSLEGL